MSDNKGEQTIPIGENEPLKKPINKENIKMAVRLYRYVRPYRGAFVLGMLFLFLSSLTALAFPYLLSDMFGSAAEKINQIALFLAIVIVFQALFSFLRIYLFAIVSENAMADIRYDLYQKLSSLPIPFFEERRVGELTSRITADVAQLQDMLAMAFPELLRQILTLLIGIVVILAISTKLTLLMLITFPVLIVAAIFFGKFIRKLSRQRQDALADANVVVEETLQNIQTVKAFTNELKETGKFRILLNEVVIFAIKAAKFRGFFTSFILLAFLGGIVLVVWYGTHMVQDGSITQDGLIKFILFTVFIVGSLSGMGDVYSRIQKTIGASERLQDILNEDSEVDIEREKDPSFEKLKGEIQFDRVSFSYPTRNDVRVIHDLSLEIKQGQKVALVGQSGAGKSTIGQLLLRFYTIEGGTIRIDGKNISSIDFVDLRRNIATVPQEVLLFGGTIRENIAYGKLNATDEEVINAAKKANAWDFVKTFPEQLNTLVGERGVKLSGGQRQRIAIARAILKDPSILILDEATSSLDAESENLVQTALEKLMEGRTTIIIAHRLSTIREVNRIFVMRDGEIAEQGSFDELSAVEGGIFRNLLKLQFEQQEHA